MLRTETEHIRQCGLLGGDDHEEKSTEYGINSTSELLSLQYINLCNGILVPDVMHDLLEGALQYEAKLLLNYFISDKKYFHAKHLTHMIQAIELGYMKVKNRPTPITGEILRARQNTLKQNGMYM